MNKNVTLKYVIASTVNKFIQIWLRLTGKRMKIDEAHWLYGPYETSNVIGEDFYQRYAKNKSLTIKTNPNAGLIPDFSVLSGNLFDASKTHLEVKNFYEKTTDYKMEIWSQWDGFISIGAKMLIQLVSEEIKQLNIPLDPMDTSRGMSSSVIQLCDTNNKIVYTCWLRKLIKTQKVVYAGFYTTVRVPNYDNTCVKVVFPMPKGCIVVILRPEIQADGSFSLISKGSKIGDPGYYRIFYNKNKNAFVKYLPLHEHINLFTDEEGYLRTDHSFSFMGSHMLMLHYKLFKQKAN